MKHRDRQRTSIEELQAAGGDDAGVGPDAEAAPADLADDAPGRGAKPDGINERRDVASEDAPVDIQAIEEKVRSLEDSLLRAKADYQNLQRRTANERAEAIRYANADLMRTLVGVLDDFDRALRSAEGTDNLAAVVEGVRLVYENLRKALSDAGLEAIDALHQPFDPSIHDALMQQPTDEHEPGTVVEQVARGYRLRDRVIRPAKVIVAKAPD